MVDPQKGELQGACVAYLFKLLVSNRVFARSRFPCPGKLHSPTFIRVYSLAPQATPITDLYQASFLLRNLI